MLQKNDDTYFSDPTSVASSFLDHYEEFIYRIYENKLMYRSDQNKYNGLDEKLSWLIYSGYVNGFPFFRVFYTLMTNLVEINHYSEDTAVKVPKYLLLGMCLKDDWGRFIEDKFLGLLQNDDISLSRLTHFFEYNLIKVPFVVYNRVLQTLFNIIINCPQHFKSYPNRPIASNEIISPSSIATYKRVYEYSEKIRQYFDDHKLIVKKYRRINPKFLPLVDIEDFSLILEDIVKIPL